MSRWVLKPLSELAILHKITWKVGDKEAPYIALEHIEEGKLRLNGFSHSSIVTSNKYRFSEQNFLFGRLRPYFRKVVKPQFSGICSTDIWVIGAAEGIDLAFLFYLFANQEFIDLANSGSSGTKMPRADWNFLKYTKWLVPEDIEEQRAIADVLSSLDDKIDLLHRQNQTLEALAQTLFRQWFIEEAEDNWEEAALGDIVKVSIGRTPPRKETHWFSSDPSDVKWISIKDMGDSGIFIFNTEEYLKREAILNFNIPIIPKNTVILSFKMTVGRVGITTEEMVSNEAIAHFTFDENTPLCKEYLYFFLKNFRYELLGSTSSIVTSINSKIIRDMNILIPPKKIMMSFQESVGCFFAKIKHNQTQIETIKKLRDTLLPVLMNGTLRIQGGVE